MKSKRPKPKMKKYTLKNFRVNFPNNKTCLIGLFRGFYPKETFFSDNWAREKKNNGVRAARLTLATTAAITSTPRQTRSFTSRPRR